MNPGHLGTRERRRDRCDPGAADRGDGLRGVDRAAATEGDQLRGPHPVEQRRGRLGHLPSGDSVDGLGGGLQLGRTGQSTGRSQQLEVGETVLTEELRRLAEPVVVEEDDPPGVPPDEVSVHSARAPRGLTTGRRFGSTSARRCS